MDPTKITRKNQFGSLAFKSSRSFPANTSRAVGRSKPIDHAHTEKVRNLSHPPLLARTHACPCTPVRPRPHAASALVKEQVSPPSRWQDQGTERHCACVESVRSEARCTWRLGPQCASPALGPFQSCFQLRSCPSLAADAAHQRRDKAAFTVNKPPSRAAPQGGHHGRHAHR